MKLAIIIVNWNTCDLLAQCLESVFQCQVSSITKVIVVDNASTDGSTDRVRDRFPQVQLIENRENLGFARANNKAIQSLCRLKDNERSRSRSMPVGASDNNILSHPSPSLDSAQNVDEFVLLLKISIPPNR